MLNAAASPAQALPKVRGVWIWGRLGWALLVMGVWAGPLRAIAQAAPPASTPSAMPAERQIFQQLITLPSIYDFDRRFNGGDAPLDTQEGWPIVEADAPSPLAPTRPSLWWNRDQIIQRWGAYRLIEAWIAFHSTPEPGEDNPSGLKVVDVQVDRQYWDALQDEALRFDGRQYAVLNQWGSTASSFGYHLRLFRLGEVVGIYACDFSDRPALTQLPVTEVPLPELDNLDCFAQTGPFITRQAPRDTLFAPP